MRKVVKIGKPLIFRASTDISATRAHVVIVCSTMEASAPHQRLRMAFRCIANSFVNMRFILQSNSYLMT